MRRHYLHHAPLNSVPGLCLQVVLSPARLLYRVLGKEVYVQLYNFLDAQYGGGLAKFGTRYGGAIFTGSACMLASIAAFTACNMCILQSKGCFT